MRDGNRFEQLGVTYGPPLDRRRRSNNLIAKPFDSLIGLEVYGRGEAEYGPAWVGRFRWKLITKYALPEDLRASTALPIPSSNRFVCRRVV
jgi:hypothetical protein